MKITVRLEGLKAIQDALHELPRATARNVMKRVLTKRAQPIAEAARRRAPVDRGDLRDAIAVSTKLTRRQKGLRRKDGPKDVEVFVGPGPLPQAHLQEFGTSNQPAQPFMRPAWDTEKDGVLEGIKADMWAEIEKAANRIARRAMKGR